MTSQVTQKRQHATLQHQIAELAKRRNKRLRMEKQLKELKEQEEAQKNTVLGLLQAEGLTSMSAAGLSCRVNRTEFVSAEDWSAVDRFVLRNKCPELFQRRISKEAYMELLEKRKGKPIPGLHLSHRENLSVTSTK